MFFLRNSEQRHPTPFLPQHLKNEKLLFLRRRRGRSSSNLRSYGNPQELFHFTSLQREPFTSGPPSRMASAESVTNFPSIAHPHGKSGRGHRKNSSSPKGATAADSRHFFTRTHTHPSAETPRIDRRTESWAIAVARFTGEPRSLSFFVRFGFSSKKNRSSSPLFSN